jgi:hypothetical protein
VIKKQFPAAKCLYIGFDKLKERPPIYFDGNIPLPAWISAERKMPDLVFPSSAVAVVGHEWNLYFDNVTTGLSDDYYVSAVISPSISGAKLLNDCLRITPQAAAIGEHSVSVSITNKITGELAISKSFTLSVIADTAVTNKKIIIIGDSLTDAGIFPAEIQYNLANGGIVSLGTRNDTVTIGEETYTVSHEGRAGWATYDYTRTRAGYHTDVDNPFWNGSEFSFSYYMQQQNYENVDAVIIGLGTNGQDLEANFTALKIMIDSVHAYDANLPIVLSLVTPPASQDGCGYTNGLQNSFELKQALLNTVKRYIQDYDEVNDYSFVHLAPLYFNLDCKRDFPTVEQAASARNPEIVTRQANNVHPSKYGYLKFADVYYFNLMQVLS